MIMVGERPDVHNPYAAFKCFVDEENKEFFIEINSTTPLKFFTRSTLLNLLDYAEKYNAKAVYVCFNKDTEDFENSVKTFLFVGLKILDDNEIK